MFFQIVIWFTFLVSLLVDICLESSESHLRGANDTYILSYGNFYALNRLNYLGIPQIFQLGYNVIKCFSQELHNH